jgi:hypothetical protein
MTFKAIKLYRSICVTALTEPFLTHNATGFLVGVTVYAALQTELSGTNTLAHSLFAMVLEFIHMMTPHIGHFSDATITFALCVYGLCHSACG